MTARVLVVDDDAPVARSLATMLTRVGFDVVTVGDGAAALQLASRFDVVVADYNLTAAMSGADVVRQFKQRHGAQIYCVVLSGDDDPALREACLQAGADDVFTKPIAPAALRERLHAVVRTLRGAAA